MDEKKLMATPYIANSGDWCQNGNSGIFARSPKTNLLNLCIFKITNQKSVFGFFYGGKLLAHLPATCHIQTR